MAPLTTGLLVALFAVCLPLGAAVADDPPAKQTDGPEHSSREAVDTIEWTSEEPRGGDGSRLPRQEGYATIEWTEYPEAFSYRLVDGDGMEVYRGPFPKAFVSGLPDGEHVFYAAALDQEGQTLARTSEPYRVTVEHWSLLQAWSLFAIGLVVFLTLVVILVRGAIGAGGVAMDSKQLSSDRSPEANE